MNDPTQLITASSVVCARPDLLSTEMSDTEAVMLDIERGTYFGVDTVAKTIWDAIATAVSVQHVSDAVQQAYETDADTALGDTIEFLQELLSRGLATIDSPSPSR